MGALLYGLLIGLVVWLIPGAILGWLAREAVLGLQSWLGGLQLTIPLPFGEGIVLDLPALLSLGDAQARLGALAAQETALVLAVALGTAAAGMLLTGLTAFISALLYNIFAGLFGGIEVTLDSLDAPALPVVRRSAPPKTSSPSRPPAAALASAAPAPLVTGRPRPETAQNARPAPVAWLSSAVDGERLPLRDDVTRIGSAPDSDIVVPGLAAQHAEIRRESGRYLIYDLGSRRTWVNDTQVAAVHMLKDGFRLQLGQAEFVVQILAPNPTPPEER